MKFKKIFLNIITPFAYVSKKNTKIMISIEILFLIIAWLICKFPFLPTPVETIKAAHDLIVYDNLICELWTSTMLCLKAMLIGTFVSAIIAYSSTLKLTNPIANFISKFRYLSLSGLSFFFTLLSSNGNDLKTNLLVFSISVFLVTSLIYSFKITEEEKIHSRTLGLTSWETLFENIIFGRLAILLECIRQTFAIAWVMLSMVEGLVRSDGGIGTLLLNQSKYLHLDSIVAILIIIFLVGILIDWLLSILTIFLCPYIKFETK